MGIFDPVFSGRTSKDIGPNILVSRNVHEHLQDKSSSSKASFPPIWLSQFYRATQLAPLHYQQTPPSKDKKLSPLFSFYFPTSDLLVQVVLFSGPARQPVKSQQYHPRPFRMFLPCRTSLEDLWRQCDPKPWLSQ